MKKRVMSEARAELAQLVKTDTEIATMVLVSIIDAHGAQMVLNTLRCMFRSNCESKDCECPTKAFTDKWQRILKETMINLHADAANLQKEHMEYKGR